MTRAKGYSLWLMPSGDVYNRLANLISTLGKKYSTPVFEPHITLIGEVAGSEETIALKTSQLANIIKPYMIRLTRIEQLNEYFRCVLVRVEETKEVMEANIKTREIFNRLDDLPYMPHLSLMYGELSKETKEIIIAEIGKLELNFVVNSIHLFSTNGEPKDWYKVREFVLK